MISNTYSYKHGPARKNLLTIMPLQHKLKLQYVTSTSTLRSSNILADGDVCRRPQKLEYWCLVNKTIENFKNEVYHATFSANISHILSIPHIMQEHLLPILATIFIHMVDILPVNIH